MTRSRRLEVQLGVPVMLDAGVPAFGAQLDVAPRRRDLEHGRDRLRRLEAERASDRQVSGLPSSRGTPLTLLRA
jgi:hypothetical protein